MMATFTAINCKRQSSREALNKTAKCGNGKKAGQNNPSSRQIMPRTAGFFTE